MRSSNPVRLLSATCVFLMAACGGGSGGGSGNAGGAGAGGVGAISTEPSVSVATDTLTVNASPWDGTQQRSVELTVRNVPAGGAWVAIGHSDNAVFDAQFAFQQTDTAKVFLGFKPGAQLLPGTYQDTVLVALCKDDQCNSHFRGSPVTITTTMVVSGESTVAMLAANLSAEASRRIAPPSQPTASATFSIGGLPGVPYVTPEAPSSLLSSLIPVAEAGGRVRLDATFFWPSSFMAGDHQENVSLKFCYDSSCTRQLTGSPISVPVSYLITNDALPEPGIDPIDFLSRTHLPHDVVDAEYSHSLESVIMVSAHPRSSLYLFDLATSTEREIELKKPPLSVSVSPDGSRAAVGHDALVSIVDLQQLQQTGTATPQLLTASTVAFDIVLDAHGFVHVFPLADQWVNVHSIEIATNTETLSTGGSTRAGTRARLHPSGDFIYGADNGLSPSDIEKYDIRGGTAVLLYDSPYHGDYGMCGDLWFKDDGSTVYTRCGNTFTLSTVKADDMKYSGKLELSRDATNYPSYSITSLSQSSAAREIALLEADNCFGGDPTTCYSHLALYESDFLNRQWVKSLGLIELDGTSYAQRGLHVFHGGNGQQRYVISKLIEAPDPAVGYYLTVLD